ncbi:MAG: hypothetical protein QGF07_01260 [Phycisphaerales bacterium]|jgi:hypothetical protein|nr:hypothetical protein [Phycisphaerales bacterium]
MTKIITIIIIVSTVWSVISGIIEKNKKQKMASARAEGQKRPPPTQQTMRVTQTQQVTPQTLFEERLNALRRRPVKRTPPQPPQVVIEKSREQKQPAIGKIKPLHQEDCPLQPPQLSKRKRSRANAISDLLSSTRSIRGAIILSEVLGKPLSQR